MSSGGGKAKTPVLLNDNLYHKQFYRVLDILWLRQSSRAIKQRDA